MTEGVFGYLKSTSFDELSFLAKRLFHLDYTGEGRFGRIDVTAAQAARLREIDRLYQNYDGRTVIILHGVAPRSGTNYILDLLCGHPQIASDPAKLPEFPLLSVARDAMNLQRIFLKRYEGNRRSLASLEMLSLLGHGLVHDVLAATDKRAIILKVPHVHHLNLFPFVFPRYRLVLCMRDGRDVVQSSVKTWGRGIARRSFADYCREWNRSAAIMAAAMRQFDEAAFSYRLVRYEDAFDDPVGTARSLANFAGLDPALIADTAFENMAVLGSSQGSLGGGIHWERNNIVRDAAFRPIGRWRGWSSAQRRRFDRIAGAMMSAFGYD